MRPRFNRSLSVHLRETEDHSRLPFHPACPVCRRDRLVGSLDGEELVSRRTQAAIAAGVLAFSAGGGSAAALASPPDEVSEGTVEVVSDGDQTSDPVFDPGLETARLPDEASVTPLPVEPAADGHDISVVEQEPATDTLEPVVDGDLDAAADAPAEPPPTAEEPAPPPPEMPVPAAGPAPAPAPLAESAPQEPAEEAEPQPEDGQKREARDDDAEADEPPTVTASIPAAAPAQPQAVPSPAQSAAAAPAAAAPETTMVAYRGATGRAASGARFYTVRPGESLWSIASDLLGERASVASIARQVNRLWELNEERIGTGQPDLLFAGTRLRLR